MLLVPLLFFNFLIIFQQEVIGLGAGWSQIGQDFSHADSQLGYSVALVGDDPGNPSGLTLGIGSPLSTLDYQNQGRVQIYKFRDLQLLCYWKEYGDPIRGHGPEEQVGSSLELSCDGTRVAIGGDVTHEEGVRSGFIRVYEISNNTASNSTDSQTSQSDGGTNSKSENWVQLGEDLTGREKLTNFGFSMSFSCEGNTVASGAFDYAQIFQYSDGIWNQKGQTIEGQGRMLVALSSDGNVVAVGAVPESDRANNVTVYKFDGNQDKWIQLGDVLVPKLMTVNGTIPQNVEDIPFPSKIAISDDGLRVVASASGWVHNEHKEYGVFVFDYDYDGRENNNKSGRSSDIRNDGNWTIVGGTFGASVAIESLAISGNGNVVVQSAYNPYAQTDGENKYVAAWTFVGKRLWTPVGSKHGIKGDWLSRDVVSIAGGGYVLAIGSTREGGEKVGTVQVVYRPDWHSVRCTRKALIPSTDNMECKCKKCEECEECQVCEVCEECEVCPASSTQQKQNQYSIPRYFWFSGLIIQFLLFM